MTTSCNMRSPSQARLGIPMPECVEINGLEDAVKLAVCLFVKFDSQK